jgi:hypothetical protein
VQVTTAVGSGDVVASTSGVGDQQLPSSPSSPAAGSGTSLLNKAKTAAMSRISGVRKLRAVNSNPASQLLPEYGVEGGRELGKHMDLLHRWGADIFKINELSNKHSLTAITYTVLKVC